MSFVLFNPCQPCCSGIQPTCSYSGVISITSSDSYYGNVEPYLLDVATNIVCYSGNPAPQGSAMFYSVSTGFSGPTKSITFGNTNSNRYVAWYNAPVLITGSLANQVGRANLSAAIWSSIPAEAICANDIMVSGGQPPPYQTQISLSLCGDACSTSNCDTSFAGNGNGDQSQYKQGAIIDIDCGLPNCSCISSTGTVYAYIFNANNPSLYATTVWDSGNSPQVIPYLGQCLFGVNILSTGIWSYNRRHAGSAEIGVTGTPINFGTSNFLPPYISDMTWQHKQSNLITSQGTSPYYTSGIVATLSSCSPCLFAPSLIKGNYVGGTDPFVILSPFNDRLYTPSLCGNCTTVKNKLFVDTQPMSYYWYNSLSGPDFASGNGISQAFTIPLSLYSYTFPYTFSNPGMNYYSGPNLNLHIGDLIVGQGAGGDGKGTFGWSLYLYDVTLNLNPCNTNTTFTFNVVYTSGGVPTGGMICNTAAQGNRPGVDHITSCTPFIVQGDASGATCIVGQNSPEFVVTNIPYQITE